MRGKPKRVAQKLVEGKWVDCNCDPIVGSKVYEILVHDLLNVYGNVTRRRRVDNLDGTQTITAYYCDGVRAVYTIDR